jgi:Fungal specific transcription factor domain
VKCDEERPQCGPCRKGQRPCVYEPPGTEYKRSQDKQKEPQKFQRLAVQDQHTNNDDNNIQSPTVTRDRNLQPESPASYRTSGISPGTDVSSGHAPYGWFELLTTDVVNVDQNFLLSPSGDAKAAGLSQAVDSSSPSSSLLVPRNLREKQSFQAAAFGDISVTNTNIPPVEEPAVVRDDRSCWTLPAPIQLNSVETSIFSHFIHHLSAWQDFLDPLKHFGTLIPHLALNNTGLMKALLALSARHISLCEDKKLAEPNSGSSDHDSTSDVEARKVSREMSVQFYFETLRYIHKAMHYKSYTGSQELLATVILISTYEMIDGSNQDWERHLKGVFWIQRSQDNDGESGGLRQAVWWTWLQQDIWVALIERRRVFSFWHPKRPLATLNSPELACRAIYLLAQCINYASNEEREGNPIDQRAQRGNELLQMLQDWAQHLPPEFSPLPTTQNPNDMVFPPIWIHPATYAAAVQVHYLSQILVLMYCPLSGGPLDYSIVQITIRRAVDVVCGIAKTVDGGSTQANYISVLCLFIAGATLHVTQERALVLDLIESCERRISWSNRSLCTELESEWHKIDVGESSFRG